MCTCFLSLTFIKIIQLNFHRFNYSIHKVNTSALILPDIDVMRTKQISLSTIA